MHWGEGRGHAACQAQSWLSRCQTHNVTYRQLLLQPQVLGGRHRVTHGGGRGWLTLPSPCFDKQDALVPSGRALVQSTDGDPEFIQSWVLFLHLELDSSAPLA